MATIQGVYVALFGRPADPAGLAYFNGITNNGANLASIASLAGTSEYQTRFAGQSNTTIVNSIYQSLFGRDAEAAGLNFFVDALNKGTLNINNIAIAILDGAQGNDKTISSNKIAAADLYTKSLDTATEIGSYTGNAAAAQGRAFIAGVTTTVPTQSAVDAAITQMQIAGNAGATIALQGAAEELSLTKGIVQTGGATAFTTNNNDTINGGDNFAANDKIDGGLGIDTLNANIGNTTVTLLDGNVKNVEKFFFTSTNNNAAVADFKNAAGAQEVWSVAATTATNLSVAGINLNTTAGVQGNFGSATNTFAFDGADASSTAKLALNAAVANTTGTVTIGTVGTVAVTNTGVSKVDALTLAAAKTVTVAGDGTLTLGVASATLETVNASAFSGKFTIDASGNNALKTVTGGTGADFVQVDTTHANDITINTGAGADVITVLGTQTIQTVDGGGLITAATTGATAAKAITLTSGDGADIFQFGGTGAAPAIGSAGTVGTAQTQGSVANVNDVTNNASLLKTLITVTDFSKSSDIIKISDGVTTGGGQQALTDAQLNSISTATSLFDAATSAASFTAANKVSIFNIANGADAGTYLFVNNGGAGLDVGDTLIKVTGAAVADFTSTNLQIL